MTPDQSLEKAKQDLAKDMASIVYRGSVATGKNGLVSIDLESRQLIVRHSPEGQPVYRCKLRQRMAPEQLSRILMQITPPPSPEGFSALSDDITSVLMVYFMQDKSPDLSKIRLSPEAAALFSKTFP
jgi:hypothetical protein